MDQREGIGLALADLEDRDQRGGRSAETKTPGEGTGSFSLSGPNAGYSGRTAYQKRGLRHAGKKLDRPIIHSLAPHQVTGIKSVADTRTFG
jgi:hypothetical protein